MEDRKLVSPKEEKSLDRMVAFSDAVFGFAITLLVLDILAIPRPELSENFFEAFANHWQAFLAFFVGFLTILVCWINHHHLFGHMVRHNSQLLWINGFLLLIITFTPLPTAILAEFLAKENKIGLILFGFTYFLIASFYYFLSSYAHKNHLLEDEEDATYFQSMKLTYQYASYYTFITFFICFFSTGLAIFLYAFMFLVFAFPKTFARKIQQIKFKS